MAYNNLMLRRHTISFYHAFSGLLYALSTQPNFLVHMIFSCLTVIAGVLLTVSRIEWLVLVSTITFGLIIELVNTAIESAVDLITDQYHLNAKIAKDVAASAMLLYAIGAVIIASIIFIPKLWPSI